MAAHERDGDYVSQLRSAVTRLARAQRAYGTQLPRALPFSLMSALSTLERNGPLSPTELAKLEGVRKPSMTRALATLEERGFVTRDEHATDGRQSVIKITRAGIKAVRESRLAIDSWYRDRIKQLPPGERESLRAAVKALTHLGSDAR